MDRDTDAQGVPMNSFRPALCLRTASVLSEIPQSYGEFTSSSHHLDTEGVEPRAGG